MKEKYEKKAKAKVNKEKGISILKILGQFWNSDEEELSQMEEISRDETIGVKSREVLLKSLRVADSIVKPTGIGIKTNFSKLKVNSEKTRKSSLEENYIKVDSKKSKSKKNEEKIQEF